MRGLFSKRKTPGKPAGETLKGAGETRTGETRTGETQTGEPLSGGARTPETAPRASRIGDRFALALREALAGRPYEVVQNVQLKDFLALTPGGVLGREARRKLDFLIVAQPGAVPVLAIMLTTHTYGRDRRRAPEVKKDPDVTGNSIVTVLHLDPHELQTPQAIQKVLGPHL